MYLLCKFLVISLSFQNMLKNQIIWKFLYYFVDTDFCQWPIFKFCVHKLLQITNFANYCKINFHGWQILKYFVGLSFPVKVENLRNCENFCPWKFSPLKCYYIQLCVWFIFGLVQMQQSSEKRQGVIAMWYNIIKKLWCHFIFPIQLKIWSKFHIPAIFRSINILFLCHNLYQYQKWWFWMKVISTKPWK